MSDHELIAAFAACDLHLHPTLVQMLNEHHSHCTERRGCGYTQATRYLADLSNRLGLLGGPIESPDAEAYRDRLRAEPARWRQAARDNLLLVRPALQRPESILLHDWILSLVGSLPATQAPRLTVAAERPKVGSCPLAEQFFLEIAHGRVRRHGALHIWKDQDGVPRLIEKKGLGDDYSAISLRPLRLGNVTLPAAALFALDYATEELCAHGEALNQFPGIQTSLDRLRGAWVLRLTTLSVRPEDRRRAFSAHFQQQIDNALFSPDTTTIEALRDLADRATC